MANENYIYVSTCKGDIYKLDDYLNVQWHICTGRFISYITSNHINNLYVVSDKIYKFDSCANKLWSFDDYSSEITNLKVDIYDNSYTSHRDGIILKIDPSGKLIWKSQIVSTSINAIDIDPMLTIYAAGWDRNVYRINPDGKIESRIDHLFMSIHDLKVDSAGNIHVMCSDCGLKKFNRKHEPLWEYNGHNQMSYHLFVGVNGWIYFVNLDNKFCRIDSTGHLMWEKQLDKEVNAISVDINNNIHIALDNELLRINHENNTIFTKRLDDEITNLVAINR